MWSTDSSESKAISIHFRVLKKNEENLKIKLLDFCENFGYKTTKNGLEKVWVDISGFKEDQQYLKECFNQLIERIPIYSVTDGEQERVKENLLLYTNRALQAVNKTETSAFEHKELMLDLEDTEQQHLFDENLVGEKERTREKVYKFMYGGLRGVHICEFEEAEKKIRKPQPWKNSGPITMAQLTQMREEFWDTAPNCGGRREIWDSLKAAAEAELSYAQIIIDCAGVIVLSDDLTVCYDERGAKYELPKYVLSAPVNLIQDN